MGRPAVCKLAMAIAVLAMLLAGASASAAPRPATDFGAVRAMMLSPQQKNATGIYHDPAGGLGACLTPEGALPGTDGIPYVHVTSSSGAAGTWAWEFDESGATTTAAFWPRHGQGITAGPLRRLHDSGANAAASIDQAANIIDPHYNYYDAGRLDHSGRIGRQLAEFAKSYPGPWHVVGGLRFRGTLTVGQRYAGTTTVRASNGRTVPVTGLPVRVVSTTGASVRLDRDRTTGGVVRWTLSPHAVGQSSAEIRVSDLAPARSTVMGPRGGKASGLQYLLQAGKVGTATVRVSRRAHPAGTFLYVEKVSAATGKVVPGAVLTVKDLTTGTALPQVRTGTRASRYTDPHGWRGEIPAGHKIVVTEVKAPAGYYIPTDHSKVFTARGGTTTYTLKIADPLIPHPRIVTQLTAPIAGGAPVAADASNWRTRRSGAGSRAASSSPTVPASEKILAAGQLVGDTIWVSGDDGENGTITATMDSVPAPATGDCTKASWAKPTAVVTQNLELNGARSRGNYRVSATPVRVTRSGVCVTWVESLRLTPSGATAATVPGQPPETALALSPTIHTAASVQLALPGRTIHDAAVVRGLYGDTAKIAGSLLGPVAPVDGTCKRVDWSGAPKAAAIAAVSIRGSGTYDVGSYKIGAGEGCYTYVETLTPHTTIGSPVTITTAAGQATETLLVIHPTMHTLTQQARPNRKLSDKITVAGIDHATAQIKVQLLLAPAVKGGCIAVDWHGARVIGRSTITVSRDGTVRTKPLGPAYTLAGRTSCTTFVETMVVAGQVVLRTHPGESSETSKLGAPITRVFEIDTWRMSTQACATKVWDSLDYPYYQYGALDWTFTTAYGRACFTEHWQVLNVALASGASKQQWLHAINAKVFAKGVGHVHTFAPLTGLHAGTITIAWITPKHGWLKSRPKSDRKPHIYFARS